MLAEDSAVNRAAVGRAIALVTGLFPGSRPLRILRHCATGRLATAGSVVLRTREQDEITEALRPHGVSFTRRPLRFTATSDVDSDQLPAACRENIDRLCAQQGLHQRARRPALPAADGAPRGRRMSAGRATGSPTATTATWPRS